ncbi:MULTISPECIES: winged helix-turn-helix domain-containing protein [unclassified Caballeronia]|uniref:winged helix-turn-helix domain-containing protein n=1 Tax=unclassified Caballeronia TaxID=2646786 RepID=UPI002028F909|nr:MULTISPECIES: winged helix-turn-helix domain-containing protein [unclassified Caballeronia]
MEHHHSYERNYVLNERWLFVESQNQLIDQHGELSNVTLKPVAARILGRLIQHPQQVYRRRQLLEDGWRHFGFEVCENSLNQVICSLRSVFQSLEPTHTYIKTIPRIGYCLLCSVRPATSAELPPPGRRPVYSTALRTAMNLDEGLFSNSAFSQWAHDQWKRSQQGLAPLSLIMLQLRPSTDSVHTQATQELDCAQFAETWVASKLFRATDRFDIISADKICVMLPNTNRAGADCVVERLLNAPPMLATGSADLASTIHIGVSSSDITYDSLYTLVHAADTALEQVKIANGARASLEALAGTPT